MPRLPEPGKDAGNWGNILNDYLGVSHDSFGGLKANSVEGQHLKADSVTTAAIADGAIQENKLHPDVQAKLNTPNSNSVTSVATKTGAVTLNKTDVGLDRVNNTSDADKPVSNATQAALDTKADTSALTNGLSNKVNTSSIGVANGVASLGGDTKLIDTQLPTRLTSDGINSTINTLSSDAIRELSMDIRIAFSGTKLITYGASWTQYGSYDTQPYSTYLPDLLGFSEVINRGRAGSRMQDITVMAVESGHPISWDPAQRGVVIIDGLGNNLIEADNAANRSAAVEQLRALVALVSSSARVEQTSFTFTGGWNDTTSTQSYASGGSVAITTSSNGEYADIPVTEQDHYVLMHGIDGTTARGGRFTFTQGATSLGSKLLDGTTIRTGREADNGAAPVVFKITGHSAGTIRATFDNNGVPGALGILDAILPQSATPPLIIIFKIPPLTAPTHNKPALYDYLRTLPDIIASEFGKHIIVVDPAPGWDPATMLGADGLHPTKLGVDHLNKAIVSTVRATIWRRQIESSLGTSLT
ncbi:MAG: hypothetical protein WAR37_03795 [Candidatus Microsaccharimonas sp.]